MPSANNADELEETTSAPGRATASVLHYLPEVPSGAVPVTCGGELLINSPCLGFFLLPVSLPQFLMVLPRATCK